MRLAASKKSETLYRAAAGSPLGRISQAGHLFKPKGARLDRVFDSYALVYLLQGAGDYWDEGGVREELGPGSLIVVFPGLRHKYGPGARQGWREIYYVFDGPVFDLWRRQGVLDEKKPVRRLLPVDYWRSRLEAVLGAAQPGSQQASLDEVCRLQQLLAEILGAGAAAKPGGAEDPGGRIGRACRLLESDLRKDLDLKELARSLSLSYDDFRKLFRQVMGVPPARYRAAKIIDQACLLMHDPALSNRKIADLLGFEDEFYFSRRFKEIMGMPPRAFRKTLP